MNLALAPALPPPGGARDHARVAADRYLTFLLGGRPFGVPLTAVAEISPQRELNRMPHMPKGVVGLLDLRGTVIPVVDLRIRLGQAPDSLAHAENILILAIAGARIGALVDKVESVVSAEPEELIPGSPLLVGIEGRWVAGFLLKNERITILLDTEQITAVGSAQGAHATEAARDLERQLDEGLKHLIALAPHREEADGARIIPQMEAAIAHTEAEMAKVVDRIEAMLGSADAGFTGMARLKQETMLGRLAGEEQAVADLEATVQGIQDRIFDLLQTIQFQDIARQKLERVLNHIRGLQVTIGHKFRDISGGV